MDSIERIIRATPLPTNLPSVNGQNHRRALVHASLATAVGRKGRHLTGTFCLTGDTMEGIIQCLVFLKAFSVSYYVIHFAHFIHELLVLPNFPREPCGCFGAAESKWPAVNSVHVAISLRIEILLSCYGEKLHEQFWRTLALCKSG